MPLQNRVDPWGAIHAVAARGTMLGNRGGKFHRDDRTLGRRRWATHHWICCELHYKGIHHDAMGAGYTSLFFLDEPTALAAGHRPCFFCRRADALRFLGSERVETFDRRVHAERLGPKPHVTPADLPDGAMVEWQGRALARLGGRWLEWSFEGYRPLDEPADGALLLTPVSIVKVLRSGYAPRWHESATR